MQSEKIQEQQLVIQMIVEAIDTYINVINQSKYTKILGIRGYPDGGKTWCMMYCILYVMSKGLKFISTDMMCK